MAPKPTYAIIAPSKIRPNSDYHVSLDLANATKPVDIEVEVTGEPTQIGQTVLNRVSNKISLKPNESSSSLNLNIGEWQDGSYKLVVKGKSDELDFSNEAKLEFETKSCSIFVQTDKAIYKPGQAVKFRTIVVNSSLIPNVSGTLDVLVKDSKDNLIKQWKRVSPQQGVFSEEIQLSDQPPLGDWSIIVETHGQKFSKEFTVAEYVLPTFSVDVEIPPYATYAQSEVVATVKANYTYGKPVKGDCILTVQTKSAWYGQSQMKFRTKAKITDGGTVEVPINLIEDLDLKDKDQEREIEFNATVTENLTGKKYSSTSKLTIYPKDTKVELVKTSNTFKPGLKYTAFLKVAYQDDKPVEDNGPPVKLKYIFANSGPDRTELTLESVPVKGIVRVELSPPRNEKSDDYMSIEWRAEYRGETYYLENIENAKSPSNSFIQVVAKNDQSTLENLFDAKSASVGEKITFQVNAVEPLTEVVYKVMTKGDIVLARTIKPKDAKASALDITIPISKQMAPKARLLVYYVREQNQEIVADVLNFKVDGVFSTPVKLSSNVSETEPGGQVDITVQTQPSAYVGLLGLDQSILLLKSGNDLTREDVLQDLESYEGGKKNSEVSTGLFRFCRPIYCNESATAGEIFDDSGLVILTNELVYRKQRPPMMYCKRGFAPQMMMRNMGIVPQSVGGGSSLFGAAPAAAQFSMLEKACVQPQIAKPAAPVKLRQKFPETWIWKNVSAGADGLVKYSDKIPDTITSWFISAFAVDSTSGLGIAEKNLKINVFRPFFAQLSLPYSIIRGESVEIQVLVFNYQNKPVQAEVVMSNAKNEFTFVDKDGKQKQQDPNKRQTIVTIAPFDGSSVSFTITPTKIGHTNIRVAATCDNAGDALVKKLLVKPEGQTQYFNKAMFIKLDQKSNEKVKRSFSIEIPANAVPESTKVKVSGISDILGPTVNHIDDLLRMPYGCGEQNMINFVPNIVVLKYLTLVNRLTAAIKTKALANISQGYQRELTYRRDDGSFSAFGNSDLAGSTWLTAFVVKSFIQARPYLEMDQTVISKAIEWLFNQQILNGSFAENGEVHHKELQGGAVSQNISFGFGPTPKTPAETTAVDNSAAALTAYVLIAILHEDKSIRSANDTKIKVAVNYINSRLSVTTNPYEVSLIAHALHLADSPHKEEAYQKLMKLVRKEDGLAYWTTKIEEKKAETSVKNDEAGILKRPRILPPYEPIPNFVEVESTAYALLTLVSRSDTDNAIPSLRWLISKQNSNGGFASTQDTVIGLQALGAIAEKIFTSTPQMSVSIKHGNKNDDAAKQQNKAEVLSFDGDNALVLQQLELEPDSRWVELEASGYGTAIVQVSYQYNIAEAALKPAFFLKPQVDKNSTENYLLLKIQTSYTNGEATNMTVMEVELPSGYTADLDSLNGENRGEGIKRVETGNNEGTIFIYFDRVTKKEISLTVAAHRSHRVENIKPVPITIYDYCDRNKMSRVFYEPKIVLN